MCALMKNRRICLQKWKHNVRDPINYIFTPKIEYASDASVQWAET